MEELKVPEEMVELMEEYQVFNECRDQCINSFFKAKRAIYYGKQAKKAERKFWSMAYKLYPQVKESGEWIYRFSAEAILKQKHKS